MSAAIQRYLAFMASIDNPDAGPRSIDKMARPTREKQRSFRGFNRFLEDDYRRFLTLARAGWCISGFRACDLRQHMPGLTSSRSSWLIKRRRTHGLINKVGRRYTYYLTKLGRRVSATTLCIREFVVLPELSATA